MRNLRHISGLLLFLISLLVLLWGIWPFDKQTRSLQLDSLDLPFPVDRIFLELPSFIRLGDIGLMRLTVEVGKPGHNIVTGEYTLHSGSDDDEGIFLEGYNVVAEARLEMSRLLVFPAGDLIEPVEPGHAGIFLWRLQAVEPRDYPATLWVYLDLIPQNEAYLPGTDSELRRPLTAQSLKIRAIDLLGLEGWAARAFGIVGILLGLGLILDLVLARFASFRRK